MKQGEYITKSIIKASFILLLIFAMGNTYAQQQDMQGKRERIEAQKVSFITKKLELTPQEAQVFWPIYNQYQKEREELKHSYKLKLEKRIKLNEMTDKEAEELVDSEMTFKQADLDLQKKYHIEFKKVLPIKKVAKLYLAEEQFKKELLKRIQEQNQRQ